MGEDEPVSIGTFVVDVPNEIVMPANAVGVSRSDRSHTVFCYFESFKKKRVKNELGDCLVSIFDDENTDYFVIRYIFNDYFLYVSYF